MRYRRDRAGRAWRGVNLRWARAVLRTTRHECIEQPFGAEYGQLRVGTTCRPYAWWLCTWAHGPCPPGLHVCHSCDNPPCCNPAHLRWDTPDANVADRMAARGERKLTPDEVAAIRAAYAGPQHKNRPRTGPTTTELAAEYGVSQRRIMRIVRPIDY